MMVNVLLFEIIPDLGNIKHVFFDIVVENKKFSGKDVCFFLSYSIFYAIDQMLSSFIRFLDLENVCLETKIMCL